MHYLLLTFSLNLHYLYRYICILNICIHVYGQLSAINNLHIIIVNFAANQLLLTVLMI